MHYSKVRKGRALSHRKRTWGHAVFFVIRRIFRGFKGRKDQSHITLKSNELSHVRYYKKRAFRTKTLPLLVRFIIAIIISFLAFVIMLIFIDLALYVKTKKSFGFVAFISNRFNSKKTYNNKIEYVQGLQEYKIPALLGSYYAFKDSDNILKAEDKTQVQLFLLHGNSVYLLPINQSFDSIKDKYIKLISRMTDFKFISYKPVTDENGFSGVYFVDPQKHIGLRVYTITGNDIWYEIITENQAKEQLKSRIMNIISKQHSLTAGSNKVPKEYNINLSLPEKYSYEGFKLPEMDAYLIRIYDNNKKLVLRIIPYKKSFIELSDTDYKKYALEYVKSSGVVLDMNEGYKSGYIKMPDPFIKQNKSVFLLDLLNKNVDGYKTQKWFYLTYTDINGKVGTIYLVKHNNILWAIIRK